MLPGVEVWWVRHGATAANAAGVWQGQQDTLLSPEGAAQIRRLAEALKEKGVRFDALYASDLRRALDSARILGEVLGLSVKPDPRLRELCLGELAGRAKEDAMAAFADYFKEVRKNPWHAKPPGGESLAELRRRLLDFLKELMPEGRYLVVAHAGPIRVGVWEALGLGEYGQPWRLVVPNASLSRTDLTHHRAGPVGAYIGVE